MHDDWNTKVRGLFLAVAMVALTSGPMSLVGAVGTVSAGIAPAVVLNEIHADPDAAAGDANGDGTVQSTADEFVEIVNSGPATLDVSGWTIADAISTRHVFPPGSVVGAGCGVVVFGGGSPTGSFGAMLVQTASGGSLGLNNGGDTVVVHDGTSVVASYAYGSEGGGNQSLTRAPDIVGVDPLVRHQLAPGANGARFSPGTRIDGSALGGCAGPAPTGTVAATPTLVPSSTPTAVLATATVTPSPMVTTTPVRTATALPTATPTTTVPASTATAAATATATSTTTPTTTPTARVTPTGTATATVTAIPSATVTETPAATVTVTPAATVTETPVATITVLPTPVLTATPVATVTPATSPTATQTETPLATPTPTPAPTVTAALCLAAPRVGCRASIRPGRGILVVQDHAVDRRDRVVWKWRKGAATSVADLGDPLVGDDYALCLYDESAPIPRLVLAAAVPANDVCPESGDGCWAQARAGARVLRYKSASGLPDGVTRVVLKPGDDGAARLTLQARGERLDPPILPLPLPLRVQLQGVHGRCWESRHTAAGVRRNDVQIFRGRPE